MKIYLSLKEFALLRGMYHHRDKQLIVHPPNESISRLIDLGLVNYQSCDKNGAPKFAGGYLAITITESGINHYRAIAHDGIRYWITTGIAIAALIVSVISLLVASG